MNQNRLTEVLETTFPSRISHFLAVEASPANAGDFVPLAFAVEPWQQAIYQRAFAEAQAVVRPSVLERDQLACWN